MSERERTLIFLSTSWGSRFGGINAFNTDLVTAVAAGYWEQFNIVNVISSTLAAQKIGVIEVITWPDLKDTAVLADAIRSRLPKWEPKTTVWIGHDRITGPAAIAAAQSLGGRSAVIHHMSYDHYETYAERSEIASSKVAEQRRIFRSADVKLAVGPLLREALCSLLDLDKSAVPMLVPGVPDIKVRTNRPPFKIFLSGRFDETTSRLKQGHLALAAFGIAVRKSDDTPGLPDALKGVNEPRITVRGVALGEPAAEKPGSVERELQRFVEGYASRVLNARYLPFTEDREELYAELASASLCVMPSWHEGFGLVAWEALGAGVPLIVSSKSGVYRLLQETEAGLYTGMVRAIDVRGSHDFPYFADADLNSLGDLIIEAAKLSDSQKDRAVRVREFLLATFTWKACADTLIVSVGWDDANVNAQRPPASPTQPSPAKIEQIDDLLSTGTPIWKKQGGLSPAQLLNAEEQIVPYAEVAEPHLEKQVTWAVSGGDRLALRLIVGDGGSGKTRLGLEMSIRLRSEGWASGFLVGKESVVRDFMKALKMTQRHVCVIIDYAETRTSLLLALLEALLTSDHFQRVRIVLLARGGGEWWDDLQTRSPKCESFLQGSGTTGPFSMPALFAPGDQRDAALRRAAERFAEELGRPVPPLSIDLSAKHFALPLYVHMSALMAVLGEHVQGAHALSRTLLNHEKRYWDKAADATGYESLTSTFMASATLVGGVQTPREGEALLTQFGIEKIALRKLYKAISGLYSDNASLPPLRPDILGEALVARAVMGLHGNELLSAISKLPEAARRMSLTVLARTIRTREELAGPVREFIRVNFRGLAKDLVRISIQTPSPIPALMSEAFANLPEPHKMQVAGVISSDLEEDVLPLSHFRVLIRQAQADFHRKKATRDRSSEARGAFGDALNNLAVAQMDDGEDAVALQTALEAEAVFRLLAAQKPARFEAGWARVLSNLGNRLEEEGSIEAAREKATQALQIRQRLHAHEPDKYAEDLAASLNNLSSIVSATGNFVEAVSLGDRSSEIYLRLSDKNPLKYKPDLAMSLNNRANFLMGAGRYAEALDVSNQSVAIYADLAIERPERFLADLGMAYANRGTHLLDFGRNQEALSDLERALDIRTKLSAEKPSRFTADLIHTLSSAAACLSKLGKYERALELADRAVQAIALSPTGDQDDMVSIAAGSIMLRLADVGDLEGAARYAIRAGEAFRRRARRRAKHVNDYVRFHFGSLFVKWIIDGAVPNLDESTLAPALNHRDTVERKFQRHWVQCISSAGQEPRAEAYLAALSAWEAMLLDQQEDFRLAYLLLGVWAKRWMHDGSLHPDFEHNHSIEIREREGRLPAWFLLACNRLDAEL